MPLQNDGVESLARRKAEHLAICLEKDVYAVEGGRNRYDEVSFVHHSLPETDSSAVTTESRFFDLSVQAPFFISSMTGGSAEGYRMNHELARAAEELGVAVGMGSIRILFRKPEVLPQFQLKKIAPTIPVFTNIGGVQVGTMNHDEIFSMIDRLGVDGIAVHLNPAQELFQNEGDRDFRGIFEGVERFCRRSPVPVMVKETGFGINPREALKLLEGGVRYVNLAGSGGTNWITVEAYRDGSAVETAAVKTADSASPSPVPPVSVHPVSTAREFSDWGTSTALLQCALGRERRGIVASGGIRSGMDVAKAMALGAEAVGLALPFLRAVSSGGVDEAVQYGRDLITVLQRVMVLTGCREISDLKSAPILLGRELQYDAQTLQKTLKEM